MELLTAWVKKKKKDHQGEIKRVQRKRARKTLSVANVLRCN